jgi:hypothetical protein
MGVLRFVLMAAALPHTFVKVFKHERHHPGGNGVLCRLHGTDLQYENLSTAIKRFEPRTTRTIARRVRIDEESRVSAELSFVPER